MTPSESGGRVSAITWRVVPARSQPRRRVPLPSRRTGAAGEAAPEDPADDDAADGVGGGAGRDRPIPGGAALSQGPSYPVRASRALPTMPSTAPIGDREERGGCPCR